MSRRKRIRQHYEPRISPRRANYDILNWASAASQRARFEVLATHVDLADRSLLDIGCGLGDLYEFLQRREIPVRYTGVDLVEPMVAEARRRHPSVRFLCADVFAESLDGQQLPAGAFDVTFCSGALNLDLGNNKAFLASAVARMVELAGATAAFNLLHTRTRDQESPYFYYDPDAVRKVLAGLDCDVRILDDYLHNDFTVICDKHPPAEP